MQLVRSSSQRSSDSEQGLRPSSEPPQVRVRVRVRVKGTVKVRVRATVRIRVKVRARVTVTGTVNVSVTGQGCNQGLLLGLSHRSPYGHVPLVAQSGSTSRSSLLPRFEFESGMCPSGKQHSRFRHQPCGLCSGRPIELERLSVGARVKCLMMGAMPTFGHCRCFAPMAKPAALPACLPTRSSLGCNV